MLTSKYITPTDYLTYFGVNLNDILPEGDNQSNKANIFIGQVENEVAAILEDKCFKRIDELYCKMSDYQKEHYKMALLYQCQYKIKNGNIINDSGYDPQTGKIINNNELEEIELSRQTVRHLRLAGLWDRNIIGSLGGGFLFPWIR